MDGAVHQQTCVYLGFLYGQPMWTYRSKEQIEEDWIDLLFVHHICEGFEDYDAMDTCLDAMRDLLEGHRDALEDAFLHSWLPTATGLAEI